MSIPERSSSRSGGVSGLVFSLSLSSSSSASSLGGGSFLFTFEMIWERIERIMDYISSCYVSLTMFQIMVYDSMDWQGTDPESHTVVTSHTQSTGCKTWCYNSLLSCLIQSMIQPMTQWMNQLIHDSINHSVYDSIINQWLNQSINLQLNQSIKSINCPDN